MTQVSQQINAKPVRRVTIRDVALKAGVSIGTASRVINRVNNVTPAIRERVDCAITLLGYKPDYLAQMMRSGESRTVGIMVRDITSTSLAGFVRGAQEILNEAGYTVILACSDENKDRELGFLASVASRRVDGLMMTTSSELDQDLLSARQMITAPTVLFDREVPESFDAMLIAHDHGVSQALEHLFQLGHRRVALLTGGVDVYPARARLRGYKQFYASHGLAVDDSLVVSNNFSEEGSFVETSILLGLANPPTAIVLGGISMLAGALRAIRARGLRIPEDLSLIGSGDSDLAMLATPSISVVRWNYLEIGRTGARLLLSRMRGPPPAEPRRIIVPTEYVIRGSCGPLPLL